MSEVAQVLVDAERLVLYAGQGVHYAQAWPELRELAELLAAPVTTSLEVRAPSRKPIRCRLAPVAARFRRRCTIFCKIPTSFSASAAALRSQLRRIHAVGQSHHPCHLDPADLNKDVPASMRSSAMPS